LGTDVLRRCRASTNLYKKWMENEDMIIPFLNSEKRTNICKEKAIINKDLVRGVSVIVKG